MEKVKPMIWSAFGALMVAGIQHDDWRGPGSFMVFVSALFFAWGVIAEVYS